MKPYDTPLNGHDLALAYMDKPFDFNNKDYPAAKINIIRKSVSTGQKCRIADFGRVSPEVVTDVLRVASFDSYNHKDCQDQLQWKILPKDQNCFKSSYAALLRGDSGAVDIQMYW